MSSFSFGQKSGGASSGFNFAGASSGGSSAFGRSASVGNNLSAAGGSPGKPAPAGGFSFGGGAAATTPATGGFGSFGAPTTGGNQAPATPAFGAPSAGSGTFGNFNASSGTSGTTGALGSSSTFGSFGASGGAPTSAFGSTSATANPFGAGASTNKGFNQSAGFGSGGGTSAFGSSFGGGGGGGGGGAFGSGGTFGSGGASSFGGNAFGGGASSSSGGAFGSGGGSGAFGNAFGGGGFGGGSGAGGNTGFGGFGGGGFGAGGAAPANSSRNELELALTSLQEAYATTVQERNGQVRRNEKCRFRELFYNRVKPEERHLYKRPAWIDEKAWQAAEEANPEPDTCVPTAVFGFSELKDRIQFQQHTTQDWAGFVKEIRSQLHTITEASLRTQARLETQRQENMLLRHRLLNVIRKVEVLRCLGMPLSTGERTARGDLEQVVTKLLMPLNGRLHDVSTSVSTDEAREANGGGLAMTDQDVQALHSILQQQRLGLEHLTNIIERDSRDVAIIVKQQNS